MEELVPKKMKGKNNRVSSEARLHTAVAAGQTFEQVKHMLLHPKLWTKAAGVAGSDFELFDPQGNVRGEEARAGDKIRIDVPGPGTKVGDGYDWVEIKTLGGWEDGNQSKYFGIQLEPTDNPVSGSERTAHFLKKGATSTFVVHLSENTVTLNYFGRNEEINLHPQGFIQKIRNLFVGAGAMVGLSEVQWKTLVDGMLHSASPETQS